MLSSIGLTKNLKLGPPSGEIARGFLCGSDPNNKTAPGSLFLAAHTTSIRIAIYVGLAFFSF